MTVIGIDFGTANAMVGYFDGHAARIIPNAWGAELTPTVVNVAPQGEVTVGAVAKARGALAPQATAAGFKPFLGTPKCYVLRGQQYTPTELTALVLKSLRADAAQYLGEAVSDAVLSVPAYFDNRQRAALIEAAKLAGLTVVRLIGEATAAALAVQAQPTEAQRILVMDMGANQFTVSLLQRVEGTTQIMQQAVANHLGGNDFTHALVADFAAGAHLTGIDTIAYQQLFDQVAELKKTAPTAANTLTVGDRDYAYGVTAAHLKDVFAPLLGAMRVPLAQVLHSAGLRLTDIDQVVLAGAAAQLPAVRQEAVKMCRCLPLMSAMPGDRVAIGLATVAGQPQVYQTLREMILAPISAHSFGTQATQETANGEVTDFFVPLVDRGDALPGQAVCSFTIDSGEKITSVPVFLGEQQHTRDNVYLGELAIPSAAAARQITVQFAFDINLNLTVAIRNDTTEQIATAVFALDRDELNDLDRARMRSRVAAFQVPTKEEAENQLILTQLERLSHETTGSVRERFVAERLHFLQLLAKQNLEAINRARDEFADFIRDMQSEYIL